MKSLLRSAALTAANHLPESRLHAMTRAALGRASVALCVHRVAEVRRAGEWDPSLTMAPSELDALISFLLRTRPSSEERWLTVAFDDGYEDSAQYLLSRARRFPTVEWLFFVCPEKTERRAGFRWDLLEERANAAEGVDPDAVMFGDLDVVEENQRPELRSLADLPRYRLAGLELCRELQRIPGVWLGNHTNGHFRQTLLTPAQFRDEYRRSISDFVRLFGAQTHFAFPFGTPEFSFDTRHVSSLRAFGDFVLWSTEQRPYAAAERRPGAVLPRFPIDGTRSWRQSAFLIALYAARWRMRGSRFSYPDARLTRNAWVNGWNDAA